MLIPNDKQHTRLFQFAGTARYAYNWALSEEMKNYSEGGQFLSDYELRRRFTLYKNEPGNQWLYTISNNVCKQAVKDAVIAYRKFFMGLAEHPKYKSRIPTNAKYSNPRITYDELNCFLSVGIETDTPDVIATSNDGIGIDLGIKDLAICSSGHIYRNINKTSRVRRLKKKQRRLQRKISRKYDKNKKGGRYQKTRNIIRSEKQLLRVTHKLTDIRTNYIHQVTIEIIKRERRSERKRNDEEQTSGKGSAGAKASRVLPNTAVQMRMARHKVNHGRQVLRQLKDVFNLRKYQERPEALRQDISL